MPSFSIQSAEKLNTCDLRLQNLFNEVIKTYDCTIIEGHRSEEDQQKLFNAGRTKVLHSNHNFSPSRAVDAAPYIESIHGIPWPSNFDLGSVSRQKATAQFYHFAGYVQALAVRMGISIRWGGDWDRDHYFSDQTFDDLVHFELI